MAPISSAKVPPIQALHQEPGAASGTIIASVATGDRLERVADAYKSGLEHLRSGRYFAAHEDLEIAWRAAAPDERDFYQGLVHVAVAWYQAGRGNRVGATRQLVSRTVDRRALLDGLLHLVAESRDTVAAA